MKKIIPFYFSLLPCLAFAQQANEIYLFDMLVKKDKIIVSNPQNITNHKGYDNQPFFHPTKPIIYYTSEIDSNNTDIKYYNYKTKKTYQFTNTPQLCEYSPTVTPDGKYISCIIQRPNGRQDLCKYPIKNENDSSIVLINNLKVGYHTWIDKSNLLLFILGDSSNDLHYYNIDTKTDTILAKKIGRAMHKIPNENAMSFVDKSDDSIFIVKNFDLDSNKISSLAKMYKNEDLAWLKNGSILESNGEKMYYFWPLRFVDFGKINDWNGKGDRFKILAEPVYIKGDKSMLKKITRIAVNAKNNKVAIVVAE